MFFQTKRGKWEHHLFLQEVTVMLKQNRALTNHKVGSTLSKM